MPKAALALPSAKPPSAPVERILHAAGVLFYEQGVRVTGINEVIRCADVAKATFYSHFESKEALVRTYLQRRHTTWFEHLYAFVEATTQPIGRVLACFDFLDTWMAETNYRGCGFINLLGEGAQSVEIAEEILSHKKRLRKTMHRLVQNTLDSDTRTCADHVLLLFEGALVEAQIHRDRWPIVRGRKLARQVLRAGRVSNK